MARSRLDKTLADYVVIAISPALIMTLVGSLVFFLMEVSYRGQFESRMQWIVFWFVFAAVLVARIAIEEGREHAQLFGIAMCAVAAIAVFRFVDAVIVGWILLAVVWWCSSKLTWDCTLIDESEDTSGQGLLQAGGFDNPVATEAPKSEQRDRRSKNDVANVRHSDASKQSDSLDQSGSNKPVPVDSSGADSELEKTQSHAPGLWVVYFSLAALPLFGVGQLLIPAQESGRRTYAFQLLIVYVASAIALLLTTSFLGLRRYLRQRKLEMPASMTLGWLGMGTALLVTLMLVALIIPRPQGEYTLTTMIDKLDAKVRQASQLAMLKGDRAEGPGRKGGERDPNAKQPGEGQPPDKNPSQPAQPSGPREPGGKEPGNSGQAKSGESQGKRDSESKNKPGGSQQGKSGDQSNPKSDANDKSDKNRNDAGKTDQRQKADAQPSKSQTPQDQQPGEKQARRGDQAQKPSPSDAAKTPPTTASTLTPSSVIAWMAPLLKWFLYGLLAIVGIYFLVRNSSQFVDFLTRLWSELCGLFGRQTKQTDTKENEEEPASRSKRPFASYENPFFSGTADRMSPPQLIRYTFEALEAWSREQVVERPPDQTPLEFAQEIGRRIPAFAKDVAQAAQLYTQIAYARKVPSRDRLEVLERLWRRLNAPNDNIIS